MTVPTSTAKSGPYAGAGTTGPFTVGFRFLENSHLQVIRTSTLGLDSTLALTTDYTVTGAGGASGTVTLVTALTTGEKLTIIRDVPFTQEADYVQNDAFPAESHERALDKLTMEVQQVAEEVGRALTLPATVSGVSTVLPTPEANKVIAWNPTANALQNLSVNEIASIVAYGTAASDIFTGTGSQVLFVLSSNPGALNNLDVSIGGVTQLPGIDYTWSSGTTVTFTTAPVLGAKVLIRYMQALALGTADAGSVQYTPAGTGAVATTVQAKLRETVSVKDFGAVGDGVADDRTAIANAITAVSASGGGVIYFPPGTYIVASSFTVPTNINLKGAGQKATTIKRGFTGDFITSFGGYASLEDLTIDGNTATWGTGKGVIFAASSPSSHFLNVEIINFVQSCVSFGSDAASTFRANSCTFVTTGATGVVAAVACTGVDTAATSRHFYNCESAGCTLFDFSGTNDTYVSGGYTRDFITNANTSKLLLNNMRVANAGTMTIAGSSNRIDNCIFADAVTLTCINSLFNCEVPSYAITDNGTGNQVFHGLRSWTPAWTASGTAPAIGNASIAGRWSRAGSLITFSIDFSIGSTSTVGTGIWYFSLPRVESGELVQMFGSGYASNAASSAMATYVLRCEPGGTKIRMYYIDTSGIGQSVGATLPAAVWGAGSVLRLSGSYYTT